MQEIGTVSNVAYQLDLGLSTLFDIEDERLFKTSLRLVKSQEGLVGSLWRLVIGCRQDQLERVGLSQLDLLADGLLRR